MCHHHVVPISWDPQGFFRLLARGNSLCFKKRFHGGCEIRTHDERPMVLPSTSFVKALVPWATGKRLTHRLSKLSLLTTIIAAITIGIIWCFAGQEVYNGPLVRTEIEYN